MTRLYKMANKMKLTLSSLSRLGSKEGKIVGMFSYMDIVKLTGIKLGRYEIWKLKNKSM